MGMNFMINARLEIVIDNDGTVQLFVVIDALTTRCIHVVVFVACQDKRTTVLCEAIPTRSIDEWSAR